MKKYTLFTLLLVFSALLSACGSSLTSLNVKMTDFSYSPMQLSVAAGKEISLNITNDGKIKHEFVIMKSGQTVGDDFGPEDEENIYWEVEVEPGQSKQVSFTAPAAPGDYQVVCGTPGHFKAGMKMSLTVVQ